MSTLAKRASARQVRIMRAVAGAVRNASHAHPDWNIPYNAAGSIAKRAAGTLTAQWPEVLAAVTSSEAGGEKALSPRHKPLWPCKGGYRGSRLTGARRDPITIIHREIGNLAGQARRAGQDDRRAAFVEALQIIASHMDKDKA